MWSAVREKKFSSSLHDELLALDARGFELLIAIIWV